MNTQILLLLLCSALGHATWNAIARRVEERDTLLTLALGVAVIFYAPMAVFLAQAQHFPAQAWLFVGVSTVFEILYVTTLGKAYRMTELTIAYPVIRGTAPLVTAVLSMILSGTLLGLWGLGGILLSVLGILMINSTRFSLRELATSFAGAGSGVRFALLTGVFTACYNVSDSYGAHLTSGFLFKYFVFVCMFVGKWGLERGTKPRGAYVAVFKRHPVVALVAGVLIFGANALGVYAMQSTPVAYVASVRETSIVFAALIGLFWLKERVRPVKWVSIALILLGVVLIKGGN